MSRIGDKVRSLRTAKGMTQKQLAKSLGVSEKVIEEVENGRRVLNDDLLKRVSKVLEQDVSGPMLDILSDEAPTGQEVKAVKKVVEKEVQKVWNDAFDSVLKTIPVYDYNLNNALSTRQLPVISNKVEGYPKDKVIYIQIQDNDMIGFRIVKGDLAFAHLTNEIENNAICLVEYNDKRALRQLKKLEGGKILLLHNRGSLITETVSDKDLKVIARLDRVEIKL